VPLAETSFCKRHTQQAGAVLKRTQIILAIVAIAILVLALLYYFFSNHSGPLAYSGTIETREIQIGSKIGGRVTAVDVEEGQQIPVNTPLISFEASELEAQRAQAQALEEQAAADYNRLQRGNRPEEIAQADATLHEQQALLQKSNNGPRPQELHQAQADYAAAQANAVDAASTYDRMKSLAEKDVISHLQFDSYTAQRNNTAQVAESARQKLALLQAGNRTEDIHAAQARYQQALDADNLIHQGFRRQDIDAGKGRLAEAQAHVQELDARLKEANLVAPTNALVETVSVRPGDLVPANQIVISLLESDQLWVRVYVPETDLSRLKIGQPATVTVDALGDRHFDGHIQEISSAAEFLPRNVQTRDDREHQVFGVKVHVDNPDGVLKSGMSATVRLQ
jgi:HlyD family secretion protein